MGAMKSIRYEIDKKDHSEMNELKKAEIRWGLLPYIPIKKDTPLHGSVPSFGFDLGDQSKSNILKSKSGVNL